MKLFRCELFRFLFCVCILSHQAYGIRYTIRGDKCFPSDTIQPIDISQQFNMPAKYFLAERNILHLFHLRIVNRLPLMFSSHSFRFLFVRSFSGQFTCYILIHSSNFQTLFTKCSFTSAIWLLSFSNFRSWILFDETFMPRLWNIRHSVINQCWMLKAEPISIFFSFLCSDSQCAWKCICVDMFVISTQQMNKTAMKNKFSLDISIW